MWALQVAGLAGVQEEHSPTKPGVCTITVCAGFRVVLSAVRPRRHLVVTTSLEVDPEGAAAAEAWLLALRRCKVQDLAGLVAATKREFGTPDDVSFVPTPAEAV